MRTWLLDELAVIKGQNRYRELKQTTGLIDFSSNDYLGLSKNPEIKAAAMAALQKWGAGSGASRLVSGNLPLHGELEREIASWKGTEAALLFNSGYQANIGAIPALMGEGDLLLSDRLNHASLIDGIRLSKAETKVFPHNDMAALEDLLKTNSSARRRLIVSEAVFSMDGDCAPLLKMLELAETYDAMVYLDEAHAVGVLGETGAGLVEALQLSSKTRERLIQMGTLGKALGSFGAYIAGPQPLIDFLLNRARAFIFTTALPPSVVAASKRAIEMVRERRDLQSRLWENIGHFHRLVSEFMEIPAPHSAIVPIILGSEERSLAISSQLKEAGFFVQAIRPPTVPEGTSRLRLTFSALHRPEEIEKLTASLRQHLA